MMDDTENSLDNPVKQELEAKEGPNDKCLDINEMFFQNSSDQSKCCESPLREEKDSEEEELEPPVAVWVKQEPEDCAGEEEEPLTQREEVYCDSSLVLNKEAGASDRGEDSESNRAEASPVDPERCEADSHNLSRTGTREKKKHICPYCNRTLTQRSSLVRHLRTHTGDKPFACYMCEMKFADRTRLVEHTRTHTGEKPYACTMCEMTFSQSSHLVRHRRTHSGDKPYGCTMCWKKFSAKDDLRRHFRTHTGEKPYACTMCDMRFSQKGILVNHLRTHTGERPYACPMCEMKFTQCSSLSSHIRWHAKKGNVMKKACST